MKSENQIIVRSKQPIKIEKPFQSLLTFSLSDGEKKYSSKCLNFLNTLQIEFMFLRINIFWALLRAHFNPCLMAPAKMI